MIYVAFDQNSFANAWLNVQKHNVQGIVIWGDQLPRWYLPSGLQAKWTCSGISSVSAHSGKFFLKMRKLGSTFPAALTHSMAVMCSLLESWRTRYL